MKAIRILSLTIFLSSCISAHKHQETPPPAPVVPAAAEPSEKISAPPTTSTEESATAVSTTGGTTEATPAVGTKKKEKAEPAAHPKGVEPKQALLWLQHGNTRFVKGHVRKDGQSKKDIARLVAGQKPHTIILSCSDSRVPPEIIFDQKLGEIFVIRTAGEALDNNVIGSIEYAVEHLGTRLILVMGHTECGAVKAAIATPVGGDAGSPAISHIVADIQPRIQASMAKGKGGSDASSEAMANAQGIVDDLKKLSAILRTAADKGDIEIKPALYHMNSGSVSFE